MVDLLQLHLAEDEQPQPQLLRVEHSNVLPDVAFALQSLLPLKDRSRRQVYRIGQLFCGQFSVFLKNFQYFAVCFVEFVVHTL